MSINENPSTDTSPSLRVVSLFFFWILLFCHCSDAWFKPTINVYTSYQEGITCSTSFPTAYPTSLSKLQAIVRVAARSNVTVKALGHLHSVSDMICTDGMPINMDAINHFNYDSKRGHATVGAGSTLHQFTEQLHKVGRALRGAPAYGNITIGGAIATGAHGSSLKFPTTLSDQIVSLKIINGFGELRNVSDESTLNAFRAHLGLLGILYEVTFRTVPQFKIKSKNYPVSEDILWQSPSRLIGRARYNDFFYFLWFPSAKKVVLSESNIVPVNSSGECETHFIPNTELVIAANAKKTLELLQSAWNDLGLFTFQSYSFKSFFHPVYGKTPIYTLKDGRTFAKNPIGFSHRMLSNRCKPCAWDHGKASLFVEESAVIIPLDELPSALKTMNSILLEHPTEFYVNGILFRFITPSAGLMSINAERESVAIEWALVSRVERYRKAKVGLSASQALVQALVRRHHGRTHWGKNGLYYSSPKMIRLQYGQRLKSFLKHMENLDPNGVFLNDFGRRVRFGDNKMTLGEASIHCALADHCICKYDTDCGPKESMDYKCGELEGYNVCMEDLSELKKVWRLKNRKIIQTMHYFSPLRQSSNMTDNVS